MFVQPKISEVSICEGLTWQAFEAKMVADMTMFSLVTPSLAKLQSKVGSPNEKQLGFEIFFSSSRICLMFFFNWMVEIVISL